MAGEILCETGFPSKQYNLVEPIGFIPVLPPKEIFILDYYDALNN
jgi:hypothetical protein